MSGNPCDFAAKLLTCNEDLDIDMSPNYQGSSVKNLVPELIRSSLNANLAPNTCFSGHERSQARC